MLAPLEKSYDQPRQHIKKQKYYFGNKGPSSQSYGFSSSHVWMWELDYKENWAPKNSKAQCFWTVVLEKTLESPLDCKEIQQVNPKGNQSWLFSGRSDAETEAPILWPPDAKNWLIGKDPDAGKDWGQEEKGTTEDEMIRWHHRINGHEFEEVLGVGDEQEGVVCCSPWVGRVRHEWATEQQQNQQWINQDGVPPGTAIGEWVSWLPKSHVGSRITGKGLVSGWWAVCVCGVLSGLPKPPGLPSSLLPVRMWVWSQLVCAPSRPGEQGVDVPHKHPASTYCVLVHAGH